MFFFMKYGGLLKAKLQETCAQRGLSTEGTKDVLVERLEENDRLREELEGEEATATATATTTATAQDGASAPVEADAAPAAAIEDAAVAPVSADVAAAPAVSVEVAPVASAEPAETVEPVEPAAAPVETEDERKARVLADLTKRAARARRFGDEDAAKALDAQISRINKFGLQPEATPKATPKAAPKAPRGLKSGSHAQGISKPGYNKYHKNNRVR